MPRSVYTQTEENLLIGRLKVAFTHFQPKYKIESSIYGQEVIALITISVGGKGRKERLEELAQILELPVLLERLNLLGLPILKLEYVKLDNEGDQIEPTFFVSVLAYYLCGQGVALRQHYYRADRLS